MTFVELFISASDFAFNHMQATDDAAIAFGEWYSHTYPDGDKAMSIAWDYWVWNVAK